MTGMRHWQDTIALLEIGFQPILGVQTGGCVAAQACIPETAASLLEAARRQGAPAAFALSPLEAAIARFAVLDAAPTTRLVLALGDDLAAAREWIAGSLPKVAEARAIGVDRLCLSLAEPVVLARRDETERLVLAARRAGFTLMLDQFAGGGAAFKLLLDLRPEIVRLQRGMAAAIVKDTLKRALVAHAVEYAHLLGAFVTADGVTTAAEFMVMRDLDVDWAQGPLLAGAGGSLAQQYDIVNELKRADRRKRNAGQLASDMIEPLPPLAVSTSMTDVLEFFRKSDSAGIAPVVDEHDRPLGLIRERDLRDLVYSRFGGELLRNRIVKGQLRNFLVPSPTIEADARIDRLLNLFTGAEASDGIIITRDQRYLGYLSAATLVRLAHERHLSLARDQNPLTKLPGNSLIADHIDSVLSEPRRPAHLVYFDFDSFKPFNDSLGFRQGDRAILMFAEILQAAPIASRFIGHVGGDDFFLSVLDLAPEKAAAIVRELQGKFARDAESLYDPESRAAGSIRAKDRDGNYRDYALLSVSAVMATLPADRTGLTPDQITRAMADAKGVAKANGFHHLRLAPPPGLSSEPRSAEHHAEEAVIASGL